MNFEKEIWNKVESSIDSIISKYLDTVDIDEYVQSRIEEILSKKLTRSFDRHLKDRGQPQIDDIINDVISRIKKNAELTVIPNAQETLNRKKSFLMSKISDDLRNMAEQAVKDSGIEFKVNVRGE